MYLKLIYLRPLGKCVCVCVVVEVVNSDRTPVSGLQLVVVNELGGKRRPFIKSIPPIK